MLSNLPGLLNVALCTVIVLTLFFYRRRDSRHKPLMSWLAWLLMLLYAFAPLSYLCGRPLATGWLEVFFNLLFCVLVIWAIKSRWLPTPLSRFLAVLATGGAIGNGIDRFFYGYVVDMFEVEFMNFAVFNIADAFLCVSAAFFVVWTLLYKEEKPNESDSSLSEGAN